jgi:hypothetical protein
MDADVKARVAVASRGFASAAAVGFRTPPARETGTGVVGFPPLVAGAAGVGAGTAADDEASATGKAVGAATAEDAGAGAGAGAGAAAPPAPKVNVWVALPAAQGAWSRTAPATAKQVPAAFPGESDKGPALPSKGNNWELVTRPPMMISEIHSRLPGELATIGSTTTREHDYGVSCGTSRIKVHTGLSLGIVSLKPSNLIRKQIPKY